MKKLVRSRIRVILSKILLQICLALNFFFLIIEVIFSVRHRERFFCTIIYYYSGSFFLLRSIYECRFWLNYRKFWYSCDYYDFSILLVLSLAWFLLSLYLLSFSTQTRTSSIRAKFHQIQSIEKRFEMLIDGGSIFVLGIMIKLTSTNYSIWKFYMEDLLYCKDFHDPIEKIIAQSD